MLYSYFSFFTKERFCLSGYLCNFSVRFWMYTEASCDNQRQVTRRRGKQIIYISLKIDPNVNELLLEIWSLRQISPTAAQMGILQDIPIGDNLDRTLLWPDIAGPSFSNWKKVLFRGDIQTMEMNWKKINKIKFKTLSS